MSNRYGKLPKNLGFMFCDHTEMMTYQYLPIKLNNSSLLEMEDRMLPFELIVKLAINDFIGEFGYNEYLQNYVYITLKCGYQAECTFNRKGYHSDGFLTDDINYIWSDRKPTIFNDSKYDLTLDDEVSLKEMEDQSLKENEKTYPMNTLLRLDQYSIHKVNESSEFVFRKFLKISFSKDKYDLEGNSINRGLDYRWKYKQRKFNRNIPQTKVGYEDPAL